MKNLLGSILLLLGSLSIYAQNAIVRGKVTDAESKEPLGGVSIFLDGKGFTTSASDGNYSISLQGGYHTFEFRFIGYQPFTRSMGIIDGDTILLNVALKGLATELGTVVISAGKFEQKLEEVTVSMEVIKSDLALSRNTTNMEDLMQQCPGVNVLDGQANIRGGSGFSYGAGTRVMILVDDLPILTADAGDVKWNLLPVENIEQVEVIKGASSALFGSSALNGVINFRTSWPRDTPMTKVSISTGLYGDPQRETLRWYSNARPFFSNVSFLHSRQAGPLDISVSGSGFSDDGYRQLEKEQRLRFGFNTRYRFQKIRGLSAGINGTFMDTRGGYFILWHNADSAYFPSGGAVSDYHTLRKVLDPFAVYITPGGHKHSLRSRYYEAENRNNTNQESISRVNYSEYQFQLRLKNDLTLTQGIAASFSAILSDSLYGHHDSRNYGIFFQADKKIRKLNISVGLRGEYARVDTAQTRSSLIIGQDTLDFPIHPVTRAGLNYHVSEFTWLRTSFGQGYRFPSVAEKFISTKVSGLTLYPNPDLQPETGWSTEIGAKQGFRIGKFKGYADLAAFWQEYRNMMEFTFGYWVPDSIPNPPPTLQAGYFGARSINVGRARITGLELTLAGEGNTGAVKWIVLGGYTYIYPIDLDYDSATSGGTFDGPILKYRYEHTAKFDIQAEYRKWNIGLSIRYNSFMKNIDASFQAELFNDLFPSFHTGQYILPGLKEYREEHNKGDVILDMHVSYELGRGVKVAAIVNNLLNREYMGRPGDIQPPRNFAVQIRAAL